MFFKRDFAMNWAGIWTTAVRTTSWNQKKMRTVPSSQRLERDMNLEPKRDITKYA